MAIVNENSLIASSKIPQDDGDEGFGKWIKEGGKWIFKKGADILGFNNGGITSLRR